MHYGGRRLSVVGLILVCLLCGNSVYGRSKRIDLSRAVIVHSPGTVRAVKAAEFLQYEIQWRTGVKLSMRTSAPGEDVAAIVLGNVGDYPEAFKLPAKVSVPDKAEGYAIWVDKKSRKAPTVYLAGRDDKGRVFAVGRLIRLLYLAKDFVQLQDDVNISTAPDCPTRGHQIIRSTQCEDGFIDWRDPAQEQQHARDLILFGTNGFEARTPEDIDEYLEELDIDLYFKVTCQAMIDYGRLGDEEIKNLFTDIVGIDHVTTYGGDASGSRPPMGVFPNMERVIPLVLETHKGAKWWYSNQCLDDHAVDYDEYIFDYIKNKQPTWLTGMVYGPWTKRGIAEIRADLPEQYGIRHYPEICHVRWCQYPVPKWDRVWAQIWPRNHSIYAMPQMAAAVHRATRKDTIGFVPYNHTGSYNDLNKFVWSAVGWDPDAKVKDILYDYGRAFFAYDHAELSTSHYPKKKDEIIEDLSRDVAKGLLLLDEIWTGHLADNESAKKAEKLWQDIVTRMGGAAKNWRAEMFLCKAMLDAQVKRKYDAEMEYERAAYKALKRARKTGVSEAVAKARAQLARIDTEFKSKEVFKQELKSWGISGKFGDMEEVLDNIYSPLNDRNWLEKRLDGVKSLDDIEAIVNYEDAGPGGFYDNLGAAGRQPHLVRAKTWEEDPGFVYSPIEWVDHNPSSERRHSQMTHATSRYTNPLQMRWEGLDKKAQYRIKVVYLGPFNPEFTCRTDDGHEVHGPRGNTESEPVTYSIPKAATSDGVLQLQWDLVNVVRGVSVTEIWLVKE